ncbi:hypothetical protein GCM10027360_91150 [Amycolatopsis echigonensis]
MAEIIRPLASAGVLGTTTFMPGRCAKVHPTSQYTNLNLLVSGLPVSVKAPHAKVRRDGYRQPARSSRNGDSG